MAAALFLLADQGSAALIGVALLLSNCISAHAQSDMGKPSKSLKHTDMRRSTLSIQSVYVFLLLHAPGEQLFPPLPLFDSLCQASTKVTVISELTLGYFTSKYVLSSNNLFWIIWLLPSRSCRLFSAYYCHLDNGYELDHLEKPRNFLSYVVCSYIMIMN